MRIGAAIDQSLQQPFPGYFALVMATGIISIAAHLLGINIVAWLLLALNVLAYLILLILGGAAVARYPRRVFAELANRRHGAGFFTLVASTCILGSQVALLLNYWGVSAVLWIIALLMWALLVYAFLFAMLTQENKPPIEKGIDGTWLILIVATQGLAVLGATVAPHLSWGQGLFTASLLFYLLGGALYILLITILLYRLALLPLAPQDLTPPYWIDMGAAAITTLAGSLLALAAPRWTFLQEILPFLRGLTLFFWTAGTFWIPLLLLLEIWRLGHKRVPARYDPAYWSMVFPLGMYSACSFQQGQATGLAFLRPIAHAFFYIALVIWAVVLVGMIGQIGRKLLLAQAGDTKG